MDGVTPVGFGAVYRPEEDEKGMRKQIPPEAVKYDKVELQPPTWGENILFGLKKIGLALGVVGCSILTLGLLPLVGLGCALTPTAKAPVHHGSLGSDPVERPQPPPPI